MRPLIKQNTQADNIVTYLQLELGKIKTNKETLCFITDKDLTVTIVDKYNVKDLINHSILINVKPVSIAKGTRLFIPLADLPFKQTDTDLTIQYALNSNGEYLQFVSKSSFDDYTVRYLSVNLLDGSITIKSDNPKPVKKNKPERQLITATQWYEEQMIKLGLTSIEEVDTYYHNLKWTHRHYWKKWSEMNAADFEPLPSDATIQNFYTVLNRYKAHLKNQ